MQLKNLLNTKISIMQVRSETKLNKKQKGTLVGLGLRGFGSSSALIASKAVLGMVRKVLHVIKVSQ